MPCESVLPKDRYRDELLLEGVRVLQMASGKTDAGALASILESSGAKVTTVPLNPDVRLTSQDEFDVIVTNGGGGAPLLVQLPRRGAATAQLIPRSATPSTVVRRLSHMLTTPKTM